ncbi:glycosyltransferase family 2 protein [Formosa sp. S-31]|uniref:glycosyltransferase family 2 protein n=1 Tax=Formosa sp. S-31 TaxID=2790949 RepID=UPI003EBD1892
MTPDISVIITVYNKEHYIYNTIQSVLNQTYSNFEIIIVNDGSSDRSESVIKKITDTRIHYIKQSNQGASVARNNGIAHANTNFVALLDGDDTWHETYLESIINAEKNFPEASVFASAIADKYKNEIVPVTYNFEINGNVSIKNYFENSKKYTLLTSSSIAFKTSILKTTGGFDTSIKSGQDTDMWIRIGLNYPIVFINKTLVYYNYIDSSLSNTTFNLALKPKYDKYEAEEQHNPAVKAFIDKNRYSLAILSRLQKDKHAFQFYSSKIKNSNLTLRQNILLNSPRWVLSSLLQLKALKGRKLYYRPLNNKNSSKFLI